MSSKPEPPADDEAAAAAAAAAAAQAAAEQVENAVPRHVQVALRMHEIFLTYWRAGFTRKEAFTIVRDYIAWTRTDEAQ
jgi:hypothetical protein